LPISTLRDPGGEWLRLSIALPGVRLWLRTWEVQVGRARLFLLDSNNPANFPDYRGFTSELYGGGPETRLQLEPILGIAGWRQFRWSAREFSGTDKNRVLFIRPCRERSASRAAGRAPEVPEGGPLFFNQNE